MLDNLFVQFKNIFFIDVETTGLSPRFDEIIEVGALRVSRPNNEIKVEPLDYFIKLSQGRVLPAKITQLTSITMQQLAKEGVEKEQAAERLFNFLDVESPLVVAYNAQFDLRFIYYFLAGQGKAEILKKIKMLDALTVYRDRQPMPHRLSSAVEVYHLNAENTHRAIDDATATYELLLAMDKEYSDLPQYINLFGYNPRFGLEKPRISSVTYLPQVHQKNKRLYQNVEQTAMF